MLRPSAYDGHHPVLDPVVHHLHEVPGTVGSAVEIAVLRGRRLTGAARGADGAVDPGRDRPEHGVEMGHHLVLPADHQAETPVEAEDPAAGADVDVVDAAGPQALGPVDVVAVVRVAAVDDDVARFQVLEQLLDRVVDECGRDHDPHRPRRFELRHELREGVRARRPLARQLVDRRLAHVVGHALVAVAHESPDEVGAHPAEADHPELHCVLPSSPASLPGAAPVPTGPGRDGATRPVDAPAG